MRKNHSAQKAYESLISAAADTSRSRRTMALLKMKVRSSAPEKMQRRSVQLIEGNCKQNSADNRYSPLKQKSHIRYCV